MVRINNDGMKDALHLWKYDWTFFELSRIYSTILINSFIFSFFHRNWSNWSMQMAESGWFPPICTNVWRWVSAKHMDISSSHTTGYKTRVKGLVMNVTQNFKIQIKIKKKKKTIQTNQIYSSKVADIHTLWCKYVSWMNENRSICLSVELYYLIEKTHITDKYWIPIADSCHF